MSSFTNDQAFERSCEDYFGNFRHHGDYFKPPDSICNECLCDNGMSTKCISIQCAKPTCSDYKQVTGKCCEYVCPEFELADATTLAILITLSITLLLIIIAIIVVWRKMRRKKLFGSRLDSISTNSQQDTDMDAMIEHNSIPNNLRHQLIVTSPNTSTHSLLKKKNINPQNICSSTKKSKTNNINQHGNASNYSKVACYELEQSSSSSIDEKTDHLTSDTKNLTSNSECCCRDICRCHSVKKFEPPPAYTRNQSNSSV